MRKWLRRIDVVVTVSLAALLVALAFVDKQAAAALGAFFVYVEVVTWRAEWRRAQEDEIVEEVVERVSGVRGGMQ